MTSTMISASRGRAGNDPIFIWNGEANRRAAAGEDILNATIGALMNDDRTICTLPTVVETLKRHQTGAVAGYAPISGIPAYREAVVRDLFGDGPLAQQAVAIASPGGSGAVYAAVVNFLEAGQKMLVPNFFWGPYREITSHSGRALDPFTMFAEDGSFDVAGMTAGLERHLATQGRALVVLNFPCHNPTGYTLSQDEWREVTDAISSAAQNGPVTVLLDVAYMEYGDADARSWVAWVPKLMEHATVLVAWTASKSMCQYGARTGAIIALHEDDDERTQLDNALGYTARSTWSNCNHLGQRAVTDLLTDDELSARVLAERAEVSALLRTRIDAFNELAGAADLPTPRYDAGFFVTVFTKDQDTTAAAMREHGVYTVPIPGAVRLAICSTPADLMPRLTRAVEAGLAAVV
ncbi:MAG: aminotransferase class I/II-fold pyridoxal phosphate-dependent enzyme [Gemmatimonadota bacterium]